MILYYLDEVLKALGTSVSRVCIELGDVECAVELVGDVPAIEPVDFECHGELPMRDNALLECCVINALSEAVEFERILDHQLLRADFVNSLLVSPPTLTSSSDQSRLCIRYRPDRTILHEDHGHQFLRLCAAIQELAVCNPAIRFTVSKGELRRDYAYPEGLLSYAHEVEHNWIGQKWDNNEPLHAKIVDGDESCEVVIVRHPHDACLVYSFLNGFRTMGGGTQVDGLKQGLAKLFGRAGEDAFHRNAWDGLTIILSLKLADPQFRHATKDCLEDARARELVYRVITEQLSQSLKLV